MTTDARGGILYAGPNGHYGNQTWHANNPVIGITWFDAIALPTGCTTASRLPMRRLRRWVLIHFWAAHPSPATTNRLFAIPGPPFSSRHSTNGTSLLTTRALAPAPDTGSIPPGAMPSPTPKHLPGKTRRSTTGAPITLIRTVERNTTVALRSPNLRLLTQLQLPYRCGGLYRNSQPLRHRRSGRQCRGMDRRLRRGTLRSGRGVGGNANSLTYAAAWITRRGSTLSTSDSASRGLSIGRPRAAGAGTRPTTGLPAHCSPARQRQLLRSDQRSDHHHTGWQSHRAQPQLC